MGAPDRKEAEVRRLMEGPHPVVPVDLAAVAAARGGRLLRRRRVLRRLGWAVVFAAAVAFTVWAARTHPWEIPPTDVAPPLRGW